MSIVPSPTEWEGLEISWSEHQFSDRSLLCGELMLAHQGMDWAILENAASWAYYWQSRQDKSPEWGLGALLLLDEMGVADAISRTTLSFFGGAPFDVEYSDGEIWGEFEQAFWILPQLAGKLLSDGLRLRFCTFTTDILLARDEFRAYLNASVARERHLRVLPAIIGRREIPSQIEWKQKIVTACASIAQGQLEKVVMSRSVELNFDDSYPWGRCLQALQEVAEESFVFALKAPSGRVFMGRSPERLLAWDANGFAIDAIAGTRKRDGSTGADRQVGQELQSSQKDKWEHSLVRKAVENLLQKFSDQYEIVSDQELLVLRYVQHMRTRFQATWRDGLSRGWELLQALHPTPAVGGCPTELAKQFIRNEEGFVRGWFAGYIGIVSSSAGELAIGIRSALFRDSVVTVFAGAGIVEGSDPSQEWLETELKMQNFLRLFAEPSPLHIEADVSWAETRQKQST